MTGRGCIVLLAAAAAAWAQCGPQQSAQADALLARHDLAGAEAIAKRCDLKSVLGEVALRRGHVEEAERQFRDAVRINPNSPRAWFGLGRVSECAFNRKTAQDCFRRAHELAPTAAPAVFYWAMTMEGSERAAALETYLGLMGNADPRRTQPVRALIEISKALGGRKPFGLVSRYGPAEIHLEPEVRNGEMRAYRVPVSINGGGAARLLLDTGADGIVLNAELAARFHVKRLAATTVGGLGDTGDLRGYVGLADRVRIGGVEFEDAVVTVAQSPRVGNEQGLVGTNLFEAFLVTLDLVNGVLRLEPFPGAGDDGPRDRGFETDPEFERFYRLGHNLLVPTSVSGSDPALFIVDTGANQTLIARDFAGELARMRSAANMPMNGISGRINDIDAADDLKFKFGGFTVHCLDTLSVNLKRQTDDMGIEVAGFLGFPMLKMFSITIDYRSGLVKFECPTAVGRGTAARN